MHPPGVLDEPDQHLLPRVPVPGVAQHHRSPAVQIEGARDVLGAVGAGAREAVDGHHERDVPVLEVVDRGEAVLKTSGVREDDGAEGPLRQLVPQEPETVLPGVPKR